MNNFVKAVCMLVMMAVSSGCTFLIKTENVVDYRKYNEISKETPVKKAKSILGTPAGNGVHYYNGIKHNMEWFNGLYGKFGLSAGTYSTGISFLTYENDSISRLMIMTRNIADGERELGTDKDIKDATKDIVIGKTSITEVIAKFGTPLNTNGTLFYNEDNVGHKLFYWDFSKMPKDKPIIEKMLIIGCDPTNTIQDLFWISSVEEDIKSIGSVKTSTVKDISGSYGINNFIDSQQMLLGTDNVINKIKVDEMIDGISPALNISSVIEKIGLPTARGVYRIYPKDTLLVASWTHSNMMIKGKDHSFVPFEATEDNSGTYFSMAISQTRLIIMYDLTGAVKEVIWLKP